MKTFEKLQICYIFKTNIYLTNFKIDFWKILSMNNSNKMDFFKFLKINY